jgi:hydrogenase maturation factor
LEHLGELTNIVSLHAPLPAGKLPNDLLHQFLSDLGAVDSTLLVGPGVGEDAAALPLMGEEILMLKSDPITFATDAIGFYAVTVNVNDIAACGAAPRWLLASLLFPVGTNAAQIRLTMQELDQAARDQGLILCGGHTEITDAVTRPVVAAQVVGTVAKRELISKKNMKEGDRVLLTKRLAVEGTSIIAREFPDRLRELGMGNDEIARCRNLLFNPGIGVLKEAEVAVRSGKVSAMHDITEGGLSTALQELSSAGGHRIRVYRDRIPIYPETEKVCGLLDLSPLGLIASGSLLITCECSAADKLVAELCAAGIEAVCVGEVLQSGDGVEAVDAKGSKAPWPQFESDEMTRLFSDARPRAVISKKT